VKGKILGSRYQVIEYIGKGGFGKTYLAIDTQLPDKDRCVVKQLYPSVDDPNFLQVARRLFKKEAETLHSLGTHSQIPYLLAYFEEEEKFYLVQQYIEGHTLTKELNPEKLWTQTQVIELLEDCLNILDFIHSKNVIHRDVKPDNLICRSLDNKLVLVDFGSVKEVIIEQTQLLPSTVAIGTKGYMPTEQARGKPRFASDIYALGIIAIQALTGISPLMLPEDEEGELVWQSQANISPQLAEIITKMTRYHFKNRYQSAKEVLESLKTVDRNLVSIPQTEAIPYTPTVQINSSQINPIPTRSNLRTSTGGVRSESRVNDASNLAMPGHINNSNNISNNPAIPLETIPETNNSVIQENSTNSATKAQNFQKNKTLISAGIALLVGLTAAGGMYWLKHNNQINAQSSLKQQVEEFNQLLSQQKFTECYDRAIKIEKEDPTTRILPETETKDFVAKCGLGKAQEQAQSLNFVEALAIAKTLPRQTSIEAELTQEIDSWSDKALQQATEFYEKEGKLKEALEIVKAIPQDTPIKQKALDETETWKTEFETNKVIIAAAQKALNEEQWQNAQQQASKINSSSSDYWQQQAQAIKKAAKEKIAAVEQPIKSSSSSSGSQSKTEVKNDNIDRPSVTKTEQLDQGKGFGDRFDNNSSTGVDQGEGFGDRFDNNSSTGVEPEEPQFREDL
jgi:serine/threonine-protein kinase